MLRFRDLKVRNKILLGYFLSLILFLGLGIYQDSASRKISYSAREIELFNFSRLELSEDLEKNLLIIKDLVSQLYGAGDNLELDKIKNNLKIYLNKFMQLLVEFEDLEENYQTVSVNFFKIKQLFADYNNLIHQEIRKVSEAKFTHELKQSTIPKQLEQELDELLNENASSFSLAMGKINDLAGYMRHSYFWTLLVLIVISVLVALRISSIIILPIKRLGQEMEKFGHGIPEYNLGIINTDEIGLLQSGFIGMAKRLKLTHENLMEERDSLELKVKERTSDLEQSRNFLIEANVELKRVQLILVQSAKMAAVGLLASGIAHEINNPLTGVLNNLQLIKLKLGPKNDAVMLDFKEHLEIAEACAFRCRDTVHGLLEFAHVKTQDFEPASINMVLEKTMALANNEIRLESIKLTKVLASGLPLVLMRVNAIQHVILDIINNARWALKNRQDAEIKFISLLSEDRKSVILKISDNGCGIEMHNLDHIFEPFFTTKKVGEGTGLGLSISYQIIKDHQGFLQVESLGKDQGTTFIITLPIAGG